VIAGVDQRIDKQKLAFEAQLPAGKLAFMAAQHCP
jgi:hypothetical protein